MKAVFLATVGNCPFWQFRSKRLQDEFKGMNTRAMNQRAAWLEWAAMAPIELVQIQLAGH
jgi:hypothetical protein